MAAGKIRTSGAVFWRFSLPDCVKKEWLFCNRKKGWPEPNGERQIILLKKVNRAVETYVQITRTVRPSTPTEFNKVLDKAQVAAKKLLSALSSGKEKKIQKWQRELASRISIYTIGQQKHFFLSDCLRQKNCCIMMLGQGLQKSPMNQVCLTGIKELTTIQPHKSDWGGFRDPPLFDLVSDLASVWKEVKGRSLLPTSVSKSSKKKKYLFAEWVQETIHEANIELAKLPQGLRITDHQIKVPPEGSILDIALWLEAHIKN